MKGASLLLWALTATATDLLAGWANPPKLVYATYLGPAGAGPGIALDSAAFAYVAGSLDCPIWRVSPSGASAVCLGAHLLSAPVTAIARDDAGALYALASSYGGPSTVAKLRDDSKIKLQIR